MSKCKKANLSNYAHPNNPYKQGLGDLDALSQSDTEFSQVAKRNGETGKVITDWNDRKYTNLLMKAVLKRDFHLDLKIPEGSLAPALTNKLNYLLWIADLASLNHEESVSGIDIGPGASLYFAAIAARKFAWKC